MPTSFVFFLTSDYQIFQNQTHGLLMLNEGLYQTNMNTEMFGPKVADYRSSGRSKTLGYYFAPLSVFMLWLHLCVFVKILDTDTF